VVISTALPLEGAAPPANRSQLLSRVS